MPRPREFDEHAAVDSVMRRFWASGYEATSTGQLCIDTGLSRSSIYGTFGSKHALFLQALRRYREIMIEQRAAISADRVTAKQKLRTVLDLVIEDETSDHPLGCLMFKTAAEFDRRDPDVLRELRRDAEEQMGWLRETILVGQTAGEIDPAKDADDVAMYLRGTLNGLRLLARTADREQLCRVADVAISAV